MNKLHFIYKWNDPRDNLVKYVGMTDNPNARLKQHLACDGSNKEKDAWIQELDALGLEPRLEIIEIIYDGRDAAFEREKYWIQYYLDLGNPLTNTATVSPNNKESDIEERELTDVFMIVKGPGSESGRKCMTKSQAVAISSLSNVYICQLLRDGKIDGVQVDGYWFIFEDSLSEFLSRERKSGPKGPRKDRQAS